MSVTVSFVDEYKNFGKCVRISNGEVELLATVDLGPRIIRFGFVGGKNIMFNDVERAHTSQDEVFDNYYYKGAAWVNYGGHRLWVAPEALPDTYYPDCNPVQCDVLSNGAKLTPPPQNENGVQTAMQIEMSDDGKVSVTHFVTNISDKDKVMSPWALTVLDHNGVEIIPNNTEDTGLLPNRRIIAWPYTNLADERLYMGKDFITLRQDPSVEPAFKLGLDNHSGTAMYILGDTLFINRYNHNKSAEYEDFGASFETYCNYDILEMETLGEKKCVAPGGTSTHTEHWELHRAPEAFDVRNDEAIMNAVGKYL